MECPLIPDDDGDLRAIVSRSCNSLSAVTSSSTTMMIPPPPPCLTYLSNMYNSYSYTPELPKLATHDIAWNHGQVPSPSSSSSSSPHSPSSSSNSSSGSGISIPTMKIGTRGTKRKAQEQHKRVVRVLAFSRAPTKPGVGENNVPSDTWAWRKYGQKPIKGSPYPRGYYKCSTCKGCPARKQVERSVLDPTMLLLTYSGEHNHTCPTHHRDTLHSMSSTPTHVVIDPDANVDENISGCPIVTSAHTNNHDEAQTQESLWYSIDPIVSALLHTHTESITITNEDEEQTSLHGALFAELLEEMERQSWSMEEEQRVVDEGELGFEEVEDPFHLFSWSNNNCNMSCC